jgi:hypothetical protein
MKYQDKSFSVGGYSDRGRDEFDRIFGREGDSGSRSPADPNRDSGKQKLPRRDNGSDDSPRGAEDVAPRGKRRGKRGRHLGRAEVANEIGIPVCTHKPAWDTEGKCAGLNRNTTIVRDSDVVIAFWDGKSTGTLDTIEKAKALGKPVGVVLPDGRVLSNMKKVATCNEDDDYAPGSFEELKRWH